MAQTKMWLASEPAVSFTFVDEPVGVSLFDIRRNRLGQWDATLMQQLLLVEHCRSSVNSLARKSRRDGLAHASTGAGDHRDLVIELHLSHLLGRRES